MYITQYTFDELRLNTDKYIGILVVPTCTLNYVYMKGIKKLIDLLTTVKHTNLIDIVRQLKTIDSWRCLSYNTIVLLVFVKHYEQLGRIEKCKGTIRSLARHKNFNRNT